MNSEPVIKKDLVLIFGDKTDGAIGVPGMTADGHVLETSYFYGTSKPKNIILVSSQAGCPMACTFCEIGSESFGRNLTAEEFYAQAEIVLSEAVKEGFDRDALHKINLAGSGEPLLNPNLVDGLTLLGQLNVSFKVSTVFPSSKAVRENFARLADFAAVHRHPVQLQISLISTDEAERRRVAGAKVAGFEEIRAAGELWREKGLSGRKINLSLILTADRTCRAKEVVSIFPPDLFRFRFREYMPTKNGEANDLSRISMEQLAAVLSDFAAHGYEAGRWASPTPIEWKYGLASNVIRRIYLDLINSTKR